jgi:hypothetical protein
LSASDIAEGEAVSDQTFRGVMKGQTLVVLERPAPVPDGTPVEVRPLLYEAGSPEAVLRAMEAEPHVTLQDVGELERAIAQGRRPPATLEPFADDTEPGSV